MCYNLDTNCNRFAIFCGLKTFFADNYDFALIFCQICCIIRTDSYVICQAEGETHCRQLQTK